MPSKKASHKGLTGIERLLVWIGVLFINAIVTLIIALLLWRDKEPQKWSDVVGIFKWFLGILVGLAIVGFVIAVSIAALHPKVHIEKASQRTSEATSSYELNVQEQ